MLPDVGENSGSACLSVVNLWWIMHDNQERANNMVVDRVAMRIVEWHVIEYQPMREGGRVTMTIYLTH